MGAVFLDLDGTLTDSSVPIIGSISQTLLSLDLNVPDEHTLRSCIGPPLLETFTRLGAPDPNLALSRYREIYVGATMLNAPVYDGMFDALTLMQSNGYRLYLMTAKPHVYARQITAHKGLSRFMIREYGPELDGTFNDKGALLARALAETGETPERSVMVGDRDNDLRAGRAAGTFVIGALWGFGEEQEIAGADVLIHQPADLPEAVTKVIGKAAHDH